MLLDLIQTFSTVAILIFLSCKVVSKISQKKNIKFSKCASISLKIFVFLILTFVVVNVHQYIKWNHTDKGVWIHNKHMGKRHLFRTEYLSAEAAFLKSLEKAEKLFGNDSLQAMRIKKQLSDVYIGLERLDKAKELSLESFKGINEILGNSKNKNYREIVFFDKMDSLIQLSEIFRKEGNLKKEIMYLEQAKGISEIAKYSGYWKLRIEYLLKKAKNSNLRDVVKGIN